MYNSNPQKQNSSQRWRELNLPELQQVLLKDDPTSVENVASQKEVIVSAHMTIMRVKINCDL